MSYTPQQLEIIKDTEIPLQLKAKNVFLIAHVLRSEVSSLTFPLLSKVKEAITDQTAKEDIVNVSVKLNHIDTVMTLLANQPEGIFAAPNNDIEQSLSVQLIAHAGNTTDEDLALTATYLLERMTIKATANTSQKEAFEDSGRLFVLNS